MLSVYIVILTTALCLSGGFQQGYIASVLNQPYVYVQQFVNETITERFGSQPEENVLNMVWSTLNIMFPIASIIGQFVAAWMCKKWGRRITGIVTCALYIPGTALCTVAYYARSFELLFLGRLIWSLSNGINSVNVTVWIVECAPTRVRGAMAALQEFSMAAGSLLCQGVGIPFTSATLWPFVFLPNIPVVIFSGVMLFFVPDSPVSIVEREGDEEKARRALAKYYGVGEDSPILDGEIIAKKKGASSEPKRGIWWIFWPWAQVDDKDRVVRQAAWLGVMVKIAYVFTGARCLRSYSTFILHGLAKFDLDWALWGSFLIGALRIPATLVPVFLVDRLGRRPLLIVSTAVSVIALVVMVAAILIGPSLQIVTFIAFAVLLLVNGAGLGSVSRFYAAELVPRSLLIDAVSILAGLEAFAKIVVEFAFYPVANVVGAWSLLAFVVPTALFLVMMWWMCPESSGRAVHEVLNDIAVRKNLKVKFDGSV